MKSAADHRNRLFSPSLSTVAKKGERGSFRGSLVSFVSVWGYGGGPPIDPSWDGHGHMHPSRSLVLLEQAGRPSRQWRHCSVSVSWRSNQWLVVALVGVTETEQANNHACMTPHHTLT